MENYRSCRELKRMARNQMSGRLSILILSLLLNEIINFAALMFVSNLIPGTDMISGIIYYVVAFIVQLIGGIFEVGLCLIYLKTACGMPAKISELFYGFSHNSDKALIIQFVIAIINSICKIPVSIAMMSTPFLADYEAILAMDTAALNAAIVSLTKLLYIAGGCALVNFILTLPFVPIFFMIVDFPKCNVKELFSKSFDAMKGQYLRYCLIMLSFFPLLFVAAITYGIGLLFVIPYIRLTTTNFYLELMSNRNRAVKSN